MSTGQQAAIDDWALKCCHFASPDEWAFYKEATNGLPCRAAHEPHHCGPHNVRAFRGIASDVQPRHVVQIGYNLGHSAALWLALGVFQLTSYDIRLDDKVDTSLGLLEARYPGRHRFYKLGQGEQWVGTFRSQPQLIFIDGGHEQSDVAADIAFARRHAIPHFVFDDWQPHWGPGVQAAVAAAGLMPLAIYGNIAHCVESAGYKDYAD